MTDGRDFTEHEGSPPEGRALRRRRWPRSLPGSQRRLQADRVKAWIFAAIMLIALLCGGVARWSSSATAASPVASPAASPAATPGTDVSGAVAENASGPLEVKVGFYQESVYDLDQQASTYFLDFYMWMQWSGDRDPTSTIEFLNNTQRWGTSRTPIYEAPIDVAGGQHYQIFHVQGQFFQPLALGDYPLDKHALTVEIEDSTFTSDHQVYVVDDRSSGLSPRLKLPGWTINGYTLTSSADTYATDFGDPSVVSPTFSTVVFSLNVKRPPTFFEWKLLLPLAIVLLLGCSVLLVHPSFAEVRLAGPASAMLSLVFLQQGYSSSLPENGGLVLLDKIYALAYVLVIGLIASTIVTSYWMRVDEQANSRRAVLLDRTAAAGLFGLFAIGVAILIVPVL